MRVKLIALLAAALLAAAAMAYDRYERPRMVPGTPASGETEAGADTPDFAFTALDGKTRKIRALPEDGIILHFWASWCANCIVEFSALLDRVEKADGRLALVAVSIDDDETAMRRMIGKIEKASPSARSPHVYWTWDGDKSISLKRFNVIRVPESVLIGPDRKMQEKIPGAIDWEDPGLPALFRK